MNWKKKKVLVTGGASFIGSHLVEALLARGVEKILVVDNLSSGKLENVAKLIDEEKIDFSNGDLLNPTVMNESFDGRDIIFHLAADHGGRGYVDLHNVECSKNFILDGMVFHLAVLNKVEKVVYASSGCVYPGYKQTDVTKKIYLKEEDVGPPYDADNLYGWAKLMGEKTLKALCDKGKLKGASCRYFTVYGPQGKEDHAVIAMIAKAFIRQDPFEVWGTGEQLRNWTYIDDIVEGTILAAEKIDDGRAINLGTTERIKVMDAAKMVIDDVQRNHWGNYHPKIKTLPDMPTGPYNRIADNFLAKQLLDWNPKVMFYDGLVHTINWYFGNRDVDEVKKSLKTSLTER